MTREDALAFVNRWQLANDFLTEEIRNTPPDVRFRQLRTMVASAHGLQQSDPDSDDESATWERWRLIKERLHA